MNKNNISSTLRKSIRRHITPFNAQIVDTPAKTFAVSWHPHPLSFPQIMEALSETIVKELVHYRKVARQDIPDLLQQGWLRLWQDLQANPQLLTERSRLKAADYISNRCGSSTLQYYLKRYSSYHELSRWHETDSKVFEDSITDIVIGSSLKSTSHSRHALFARKVDIHLDIAGAIRQVADWCGDNLKKLAALYFITTSVEQVDAGRIAGLKVEERKERKPRCPALQYWVRKVTKQLQTVLASYRPIEPNRNYWRDCLKTGELQPVKQLAEKYADEHIKLLALYTLTTCVSCKTLVENFGVCVHKLRYAVEQLRYELRCLYAARVPT